MSFPRLTPGRKTTFMLAKNQDFYKKIFPKDEAFISQIKRILRSLRYDEDGNDRRIIDGSDRPPRGESIAEPWNGGCNDTHSSVPAGEALRYGDQRRRGLQLPPVRHGYWSSLVPWWYTRGLLHKAIDPPPSRRSPPSPPPPASHRCSSPTKSAQLILFYIQVWNRLRFFIENHSSSPSVERLVETRGCHSWSLETFPALKKWFPHCNLDVIHQTSTYFFGSRISYKRSGQRWETHTEGL